jgi:hypothetical protein
MSTVAVAVELLDPKPLDVRAAGSKRAEVTPFHLSADSFWLSEGCPTASLRLGVPHSRAGSLRGGRPAHHEVSRTRDPD